MVIRRCPLKHTYETCECGPDVIPPGYWAKTGRRSLPASGTNLRRVYDYVEGHFGCKTAEVKRGTQLGNAHQHLYELYRRRGVLRRIGRRETARWYVAE